MSLSGQEGADVNSKDGVPCLASRGSQHLPSFVTRHPSIAVPVGTPRVKPSSGGLFSTSAAPAHPDLDPTISYIGPCKACSRRSGLRPTLSGTRTLLCRLSTCQLSSRRRRKRRGWRTLRRSLNGLTRVCFARHLHVIEFKYNILPCKTKIGKARTLSPVRYQPELLSDVSVWQAGHIPMYIRASLLHMECHKRPMCPFPTWSSPLEEDPALVLSASHASTEDTKWRA
jgi:hypothetical protein